MMRKIICYTSFFEAVANWMSEMKYRGFMCIGRFCIGLIHLAFWHMYFGDLSGLESNTLAGFTHKLAFHAKNTVENSWRWAVFNFS